MSKLQDMLGEEWIQFAHRPNMWSRVDQRRVTITRWRASIIMYGDRVEERPDARYGVFWDGNRLHTAGTLEEAKAFGRRVKSAEWREDAGLTVHLRQELEARDGTG